jgi:hypothetical protein
MTQVNTLELTHWQKRFNECLPLFGHRNWIVVADAAYPEHARDGIETIFADADHGDILHAVCDAIAAAPHIRANILTDLELDFVPENDAAGVSEYRNQLDELLIGFDRSQIPHEEILARLDASAQLFRILILKTSMSIPYTSIFFELGCGYWNAESEARLRSAIETAPL